MFESVICPFVFPHLFVTFGSISAPRNFVILCIPTIAIARLQHCREAWSFLLEGLQTRLRHGVRGPALEAARKDLRNLQQAGHLDCWHKIGKTNQKIFAIDYGVADFDLGTSLLGLNWAIIISSYPYPKSQILPRESEIVCYWFLQVRRLLYRRGSRIPGPGI